MLTYYHNCSWFLHSCPKRNIKLVAIWQSLFSLCQFTNSGSHNKFEKLINSCEKVEALWKFPFTSLYLKVSDWFVHRFNRSFQILLLAGECATLFLLLPTLSLSWWHQQKEYFLSSMSIQLEVIQSFDPLSHHCQLKLIKPWCGLLQNLTSKLVTVGIFRSTVSYPWMR